MNFLFYDDHIWRTYHVAEWQRLNLTSSSDGNPYADRLDALRGRGAVLLLCGNTLRTQGQEAAGMTGMSSRETILREFETHLVPGAFVVPAGVAEVSRLQQHGFSFIYVPDLTTGRT